MWSLGEAENTLREEIQTFRREANNEIRQISYHIASLNNIQFPEKIQASFLLSIQRYSTKPGASPYFLHHLLAEHNLFFIAVLFSMTNTTKVAEFQHRFCMLAEFLCRGCWTFADQLAFLKLVDILLTHSEHLHKLILCPQPVHSPDDYDDDGMYDEKRQHQEYEQEVEFQNQRFMIYHNFIQWVQNLALPAQSRNAQDAQNGGPNKYHSHSYPNLNYDRLYGVLNLLVLHRPDMFYDIISFLEIGRQIVYKTGFLSLSISLSLS